MKNILLLSLFTLLTPIAFAQDVIIKLSGEEIAAKVEEVTLQEILYKHPDSLQGPTLRLAKAEVFMIRFANGTREVFKQSLPENQANGVQPDLTPEQMYQKGKSDAQLLYRPKGVLLGSAGFTTAALFTSGLSLAGPIVIAAIPPKEQNFVVPDSALLRNPDYVNGYKKQAHKRKIGRTAAGAGIGVVTGVAVAFVALMVAFSNWQ